MKKANTENSPGENTKYSIYIKKLLKLTKNFHLKIMTIEKSNIAKNFFETFSYYINVAGKVFGEKSG